MTPVKVPSGRAEAGRVTVTSEQDTSAVLVGRQEIYGRTRSTAAYEMLFRYGRGPLGPQSGDDHEDATSRVISSVLGRFEVAEIAGNKPLFVNFPRAFLVGDLPVPEVPGQLVVEVLEHVPVDDELLRGVADLRARGFHVAVENWAGEDGREPLVRVADIVMIDVGRVARDELPRLVRAARALHPGGAVVLQRVADERTLQLGLDLGADFFTGSRLNRPRSVRTTGVTASDLVCLRLLGALAQEAPAGEVERLVASDPGLAVRVLRTASSPGHAARPISSLRQAIVLLGPRALSAWVSLMIVGSTGQVPYDDVVSMLTQAGACAELAPEHRNVAYTAGLLSAVARVLGGETADIVRSSGVGADVASAILHGDGPVGRALGAVLAHRDGNPLGVQAHGFTPLAVSMAYLGALAEARATADTTTS